MKSAIHSRYYPDTQVTCACGHSFTTGSTNKELHVDICSNCHPFYTGEQRFVDIQGRVEMFEKRRKAATVAARPLKKKAPLKDETPLSLKEMLKTRAATK